MRCLFLFLAPALLLAPATAAPTDPSAQEIFRKAVKAQGKLERNGVRDIKLTFVGEVSQQGSRNTVHQTYWYRPKDRSFRVKTGTGATNKFKTDHGVFGENKYWERTSNGAVLELRRGNRNDAESKRTIKKERERFERMLGMVLLASMDHDKWKITFAPDRRAKLTTDLPFEARRGLGDREKVEYHVLDAQHDGQPPLRLYVHAQNFTVNKAVQFHASAPDQIEWVYYFGPYHRDADLNVPQYFSVYTDTPTDTKTRDQFLSVKGQPTVAINRGLKDSVLKPPPD